MRQVPIRELNQHTAEVLARVELGERLGITRNGTPVAIIEPAEPDPLNVLVESGELRRAVGVLAVFSQSEASAEDSVGLDAVVADRYRDRW